MLSSSFEPPFFLSVRKGASFPLSFPHLLQRFHLFNLWALFTVPVAVNLIFSTYELLLSFHLSFTKLRSWKALMVRENLAILMADVYFAAATNSTSKNRAYLFVTPTLMRLVRTGVSFWNPSSWRSLCPSAKELRGIVSFLSVVSHATSRI